MKKIESSKIRKVAKQFVLYLVVGGMATIVEWIAFYLLNQVAHLYYMGATAFAFVVSTFANWAFGRLLMFQAGQKIWKELLKIYAASVAGLLMNLVIMWVAVEKFAISEMPAKMIATGIVFLWNFLIRKLVIYKI